MCYAGTGAGPTSRLLPRNRRGACKGIAVLIMVAVLQIGEEL